MPLLDASVWSINALEKLGAHNTGEEHKHILSVWKANSHPPFHFTEFGHTFRVRSVRAAAVAEKLGINFR